MRAGGLKTAVTGASEDRDKGKDENEGQQLEVQR
jgi:hypothetical protein